MLLELIGLESKLEQTTQSNDRLAAENTELKAELLLLKSEVSSLRDQLHSAKSHEALPDTGISTEQEIINSNIIIRGIDLDQQASQDNLLGKFDAIRSHLGISEISDFEAVDIDIVRPKSSTDKDTALRHKTIRVKFRSVDHKRRFLQIRRSKKSIFASEIGIQQSSKKPILIVEQLTKQNQELLYKARSLRTSADFKFVWSNNGQILVRHRQGSKVIRIKDTNHIDQLCSQFSVSHLKDGNVHSDIAVE